MHADGTHYLQVTRMSGDFFLDDPAWSPDGRWIAFMRNNSVCVVPSAGGPVRDLLAPLDDVLGVHPTWSRDSKRVIFRGDDDRGPGLRSGIFSIGRGGHRLRYLRLDGHRRLAFCPSFY
jgi:Tol biopolymer transport system component